MFTIAAMLNIATIIVHFNRPDQAPYTGAIVTVFAFYAFTRAKSAQDGYANDAIERLNDIKIRQLRFYLERVEHSVAVEAYERAQADYRLQQDIRKNVDRQNSVQPGGLTFATSALTRARDSAPRPPNNIHRHIATIAHYDELCVEYREAIDLGPVAWARWKPVGSFTVPLYRLLAGIS
ncbi:hypothetical protein QCN27_19180 [Cereibacter sp. SYSU M97828]|nr:hypothetical protein [Cereibacter flavus]